MRLAKNALIIALTVLTLIFTVSAQTLRQTDDNRNIAPTVGTGGPVGGPTGLFTIYDGQTLRRGEYTFSIAYSNYDRDPGNVDITTVPVSFQIGLSDNLEVFFNTDAYRQIKVNNPQVLSSFYLPNSQFQNANGTFSVPAAIVLAPGTSGQFANRAIFRPAGAPFAVFPYTGANGGFFGVTAPFIPGPVFGFTSAFPTLGPPNGSSGRTAANFPGIGSVYGSILPGVVLTTQTVTSATGTPAGTIPVAYTTRPAYLPDAPFINRGYGQTAFNTFVAGAKWRITNVNSPVGLGFTAFYRWYADKANDASGFNQLQRGASPGGNRGDIGVVLFADSRLRKWLNLSGNVGYVYNSSVKGNFPNGTFTLLDRPDELQYGVGADMPVNQYFQPILEFLGTRYVGGRTPNAFERSPMDGIAGVRIFPKRFYGFGLAYRYNFNQIDRRALQNSTFNQSDLTFTRVSAITTQPNQAVAAVVETPFTTIASSGSLANVYTPSTDPHGFIFQAWIGRRNARGGVKVPNGVPNVNDVTLDKVSINTPCPAGTRSQCPDSQSVAVSTAASDPENDVLTYNYTVSGGRIVGQGANVNWDLSGVREGTYTITAAVDDGCGFCGKTVTKTITVAKCTNCQVICTCPTLSVTGPSDLVPVGGSATFTANVSGGSQDSPTYNWTVSAGTITSGQGTPAITVTAPDGASVTATVEIGGLCADCNKTASATANWGTPVIKTPSKVDEFGVAKPDQIKAKLDAFFVALNNDPQSKGFIINYGTPKEIAARRKVIEAAIKFRQFNSSRITFVDGGAGTGLDTELWVVPEGAANPTPDH